MGTGAAARRYLGTGDRPPPRTGPVDWSAMPAPFKTYPGVARIALPYPFGPPAPDLLCRRAIGDIAGNLLGLNRIRWLPDTELDRISRTELVPREILSPVLTGRPVPSGGRLYPSELYLATGPLPDLPAGLYHYAPALHALERVRDGDVRTAVTQALGCAAVPDLVLMVTAVFWRNAFKYGEFGYRLQTLDAGVLAGQALAVAGAAGLDAAVHVDFGDEPLDRLLGLDPARESCHLVVTLTGPGLPPGSLTPQGEVARAEVGGPPREVLPLSAALHAASVQHRPRYAVAAGPTRPDGTLAAGIPRRSSPTQGFRPTAIGAHELTAMAAQATADTALYLAALRVRETEMGWYRWDRGDLVPLRAGDPTPHLTAHRDAAVVFVPYGDDEPGFARHGDRWYRMRSIDAGLVAQRICLAAAALGLAGHIRCDYDGAGLAAALGVPGTPLAMVLAGVPERPPALGVPL